MKLNQTDNRQNTKVLSYAIVLVLLLLGCTNTNNKNRYQFIFENKFKIQGYDAFYTESYLLQVKGYIDNKQNLIPSFSAIIAKNKEKYYLTFPDYDPITNETRWFSILFFDPTLKSSETIKFTKYNSLFGDTLNTVHQTYIYEQIKGFEENNGAFEFRQTFYSDYLDEGNYTTPIPLHVNRMKKQHSFISFSFKYSNSGIEFLSYEKSDSNYIDCPYFTTNLSSIFFDIN